MGNVTIDINPEQGLGEDGMRLHNWAFDDELPERVELERTGLSKTDGVTHLEYRVLR
jgi:hypothetical protein